MKVRYYIYQLPITNSNIFIPIENVKNFNLKDYVPVWTDETFIEDFSETELKKVCEVLFETFNTIHPKNFAGHSMSVSDVIEFNYNEKSQIFYCDSCGFVKIMR